MLLFRYEDFASYTAKLEKPVSIDYRGYRSAAYIHTSAEAIKLVLGIGEPLIGRLLRFDALAMRFHETRLRPDPDCPACGSGWRA